MHSTCIFCMAGEIWSIPWCMPIRQMTGINLKTPSVICTHTHSHSPFYPSSLTPHLHLDLFVTGYHGKSHSILIRGRWPGVAANWVFRMEGGGEAVSLCL